MKNSKKNDKALGSSKLTLRVISALLGISTIIFASLFGTFLTKFNQLKNHKIPALSIEIIASDQKKKVIVDKTINTKPTTSAVSLADVMLTDRADFQMKKSGGVGYYINGVKGAPTPSGYFWNISSSTYVSHFPKYKADDKDSLNAGTSFLYLFYNEVFNLNLTKLK